MVEAFAKLSESIDGSVHDDLLTRTLYATDASVYRELPLAVVYPRSAEDLRKVINFAIKHKTSLIPRAAGTSLAGQCVGEGIVVDTSRHLNRILEVNAAERWVRVEPGVVRDELNHALRPYGLFFGPNTSTANRATLGGMVGNNSCGSTSIVYGSTRDHVLALHTVLSDGSQAVFRALDRKAYQEKLALENLEGKVYKFLDETLRRPKVQQGIREGFPKASIHRRNTGYALDSLLDMQPFQDHGRAFNLCPLLCGSEGTLAFTTEITLQLDPLPPPCDVVVCAHFSSIADSMRATLLAMDHDPSACELMDKIILDLTGDNIEQQKNRFFVQGDPAAILMVEFRAKTVEAADAKAETLVAALRGAGLGYAFPKVFGPKSERVWNLRKAGLGLLSNMKGDAKPVACIEDTAVALQDLPSYIGEFSEMMEDFGQQAVYYAHAGAGELHLRPVLNLKKSTDREKFYRITEATARLVKRYQGSLSGEHGDGRVRAPFIPLMVGKENYELFRQLKETWDPLHVFNPGKIVEAGPMNESLRYVADVEPPEYSTMFDFSDTGGILRMAEKCNGSGDCRKLPLSGGTMCPSYMATRNERDTTRARANVLREMLTQGPESKPFEREELSEVLDLCLSCKGCTSECPSNVDMTTLKAEVTYQKYKDRKAPWRARVFANIAALNRQGMRWSWLANGLLGGPLSSGLMKRALGLAPERPLPLLHSQSLRRWFRRQGRRMEPVPPVKGKVWFFCDEFTNYNDVEAGIAAIELLNGLGYEVGLFDHPESGRAHFSKGLLEEARRLAIRNVEVCRRKVSPYMPMVGLEPSAILSFRDEYPRIVPSEMRADAEMLASCTYMVEEFLALEMEKGKVSAASFTNRPGQVLLHGHCHQKALASVDSSAWLLSLPENYQVETIPSGCCGMAGSFGYEKEHYQLSMDIGELVLFPAIRKAEPEVMLAAPGTSCRHQILHGTARRARHPVEIARQALRANESR